VKAETVPYIEANLERFGLTETSPTGIWYRQEFYTNAYLPFMAAYEEWQNTTTRTPLIIMDMKKALQVLIPCYRELFRMMKGLPSVADSDLIAMGFPPRPSKERHPAPVATTAPELAVRSDTGNRLRIRYYAAGEKNKRGRPAGQRGVEIRWDYSDTPVENAADLRYSVVNGRPPCTLQFKGEQQGRIIYIAACWVNMRNKKGPWSIIHRAAVP
jgi:hypothetical protein